MKLWSSKNTTTSRTITIHHEKGTTFRTKRMRNKEREHIENIQWKFNEMNHITCDQYQRNWVASPESETTILSHTYADIHAGQRVDLLVDNDVDTNKKKTKLHIASGMRRTQNNGAIRLMFSWKRM